MTERITVKDVRRQFELYVDTMERAGLVPEGWRLVLQEGSSTYGIGWRVYMVPINPEEGTGHHEPMVGDNYLGSTAREAHERLCDRRRMVDDIRYVEEQGKRRKVSIRTSSK